MESNPNKHDGTVQFNQLLLQRSYQTDSRRVIEMIQCRFWMQWMHALHPPLNAKIERWWQVFCTVPRNRNPAPIPARPHPWNRAHRPFTADIRNINQFESSALLNGRVRTITFVLHQTLPTRLSLFLSCLLLLRLLHLLLLLLLLLLQSNIFIRTFCKLRFDWRQLPALFSW